VRAARRVARLLERPETPGGQQGDRLIEVPVATFFSSSMRMSHAALCATRTIPAAYR